MTVYVSSQHLIIVFLLLLISFSDLSESLKSNPTLFPILFDDTLLFLSVNEVNYIIGKQGIWRNSLANILVDVSNKEVTNQCALCFMHHLWTCSKENWFKSTAFRVNIRPVSRSLFDLSEAASNFLVPASTLYFVSVTLHHCNYWNTICKILILAKK